MQTSFKKSALSMGLLCALALSVNVYATTDKSNVSSQNSTQSNQEGVGEYIDDTVLTTKVKALIFDDSTLKSMEISVETFKGVVQLSGFVSSQANIDRAVEIARSVSGVTLVKNDMQLKLDKAAK